MLRVAIDMGFCVSTIAHPFPPEEEWTLPQIPIHANVTNSGRGGRGGGYLLLAFDLSEVVIRKGYSFSKASNLQNH